MESIEALPTFSFSASSSTEKWWSEKTVAIVTGANKGIGFAIVKRLAELGLSVVLTARDEERGVRAVESLKSHGLAVHFSILDVSDPHSIHTFVQWFKHKFGALDILVNNAAVSFNDIHENSVEHAEIVIKTNFYGAKLLTESLLPLFRRSSFSSARVLNISSRLGSLDKVKNHNIVKLLQREELREEHVEGVVEMFLENVKKGTWQGKGWPEIWTDYAVSKVALNAYSKVIAKRYDGSGLSVNCYCPGFVQTSMSRGTGKRTPDAAADVSARLALMPPHELQTGKFYVGFSPVLSSKL